jgi:hypothetical protein
MAIENAGTADFDYIVITWNPIPEVVKWLVEHPGIIRVDYHTNKVHDYIPNLRLMMGMGFTEGFKRNEWITVINTDMAFGENWLINLARRAEEDIIPNSLCLSPITWPSVITANLGITTNKTFNFDKFWKLHNELYEDKIETEEQRGGWRTCASFPYILHKKWWERCGPWEAEIGSHKSPPDQRFFERCHEAGAKFIMVHDSIVYHHEAVERRSKIRPVGVENMPEGK